MAGTVLEVLMHYLIWPFGLKSLLPQFTVQGSKKSCAFELFMVQLAEQQHGTFLWQETGLWSLNLDSAESHCGHLCSKPCSISPICNPAHPGPLSVPGARVNASKPALVETNWAEAWG